jgi:hypothetical protein
MPNWCMNRVVLSHPDSKQIDKAHRAIKKNRLFQSFHPCPRALTNTMSGFHADPVRREAHERKQKRNMDKYGFKDWYGWRLAKWDTKWDICHAEIQEKHKDEITVSFDTAWSPPLAFYEKLVELGFSVKAFYSEPGMGFAGYWNDGESHQVELNGDEAEHDISEEWSRTL